ncbi:hypothetical protein PUN28_017151 [Cardiocondyla obscurior]|uniref:Ribosomal protein S17 n=1 Tax=Cardiocondyla obscurior TaxID=286306 RepID=A0AAW2EKH1_9HYME
MLHNVKKKRKKKELLRPFHNTERVFKLTFVQVVKQILQKYDRKLFLNRIRESERCKLECNVTVFRLIPKVSRQRDIILSILFTRSASSRTATVSPE